MSTKFPFINSMKTISVCYGDDLKSKFNGEYSFEHIECAGPAIEYLKKNESKVIITDLMLSPGSGYYNMDERIHQIMDTEPFSRHSFPYEIGLRTIEMIREIPTHKETPIIVADIYNFVPSELSERRVINSGATDYLNLLDNNNPTLLMDTLEKYL